MIGGFPLTALPDGTFVFRPGRFFRMLVVVNGPTYLEDVEAVLRSAGFDPIASSDPGGWATERPPDWPEEAAPLIAANEALVRISAGTGASRYAIRLPRDLPIADATGAGPPAHLTVARAWDYGQAPPVQTLAGAAPPAAKTSSGGAAALVAAGGLAAVGLWHFVAERRRLKRDEQRLHSAEAKAEREEIAAEVNRLMRAGYSREQARDALAAGALLEASGEDAELVVLATTTQRP